MAKGPAAAAGDAAPTWKSYLAVRSERSNAGGATLTAPRASRKRAQPVASVAPRVRAFWERLRISERQHVLFIDEPELVKQLYKLNLSLLCVGLMQRHLKVKAPRAAAAATTATEVVETKAVSNEASAVATAAAAAAAVSTTTATTAPAQLGSDAKKAKPANVATTDALSAEKTYELLEAMEFMDIGTGILTVKSELVENPERLFTLVGDVLVGFASSLHVLSDAQFHDLFVAESETINSWEDYQRLIAMLVEQLILKSYVGHLEREAAAQMEELLLEVSLEDRKTCDGGSNTAKDGRPTGTAGPTAAATVSTPSQSASKKKKKKKRKKRDSSAVLETVEQPSGGRAGAVCAHSDQPEPEDFDEGDTGQQAHSESGRPTASSEEDLELTGDPAVVIDNEDIQDGDVSEAPMGVSRLGSVANPEKRFGNQRDAAPPASKRATATSSLNPNAVAFQPLQAAYGSLPRWPPLGAKRKLDSFVVSVFADDVLSDDEFEWRDSDARYNSDDDIYDENDARGARSPVPRRRQKVARGREGDAALEWQLRQIYATMSVTHGWDFTNQREIVVEQPPPGAAVPWDDLALWRTAPTQVVRYFGSGLERGSGGGSGGYGSFFPSPAEAYPFAGAAATAAGAAGLSSQQSESRFYFAPSSPVAISSTYLPPSLSRTNSTDRSAGGSGNSLSPLLLPPSTTVSAPPSSSSASSSRGASRLSSRRRGFRSIVGG